MVNSLTFKVRTTLNVLVLRWHLARARRLGRRLLARALTVLALPALAALVLVEAALNLVVLLAGDMVTPGDPPAEGNDPPAWAGDKLNETRRAVGTVRRAVDTEQKGGSQCPSSYHRI